MVICLARWRAVFDGTLPARALARCRRRLISVVGDTGAGTGGGTPLSPQTSSDNEMPPNQQLNSPKGAGGGGRGGTGRPGPAYNLPPIQRVASSTAMTKHVR